MIRGIAIKKLNWEYVGHSWASQTAFGSYAVWPIDSSDGEEAFGGASSNGLILPICKDISEAMNICQNHFDKKVLALITFVVEPSEEEVSQATHEAICGDGQEDSFGGFYDMIVEGCR